MIMSFKGSRDTTKGDISAKYSPLPAKTKLLRGDNETVMVVDDDLISRKIMQTMLLSNGYRVISADSGRKALQMYHDRADEISLVITDKVMPEIDGMELIRTLREFDPRLKFIMLSGGDECDDLGEAESEGIPYVIKPPRIDTFLNLVYENLND